MLDMTTVDSALTGEGKLLSETELGQLYNRLSGEADENFLGDDWAKLNGTPTMAFLGGQDFLTPKGHKEKKMRAALGALEIRFADDVKRVTESPDEWLSELVQNALDLEANEMTLFVDNSSGKLAWQHNGRDENGNCFSGNSEPHLKDDLSALFTLGMSRKGTDLISQEGRFGLGFKYWQTWWRRVTVIGDGIRMSWEIDDDGHSIIPEDGKATILDSLPEGWEGKTTFIFSEKTENYDDISTGSMEHIFTGISCQTRDVKISFSIDDSGYSFDHQCSPVGEVDEVTISQFKNSLPEGNFEDTPNVPTKGLIAHSPIGSILDIDKVLARDKRSQNDITLKTIFEDKINTKIESLLGTDATTIANLEGQKREYFDRKQMALLFDDSKSDYLAPFLSSLFPITGLSRGDHDADTASEALLVKDSAVLLDGPFEITQDRKRLKTGPTARWNRTLLSSMGPLISALCQYLRETTPEDLAEKHHKLIQSIPEQICEIWFGTGWRYTPNSIPPWALKAKIWPTSAGVLTSIEADSGEPGWRPMRTTMRQFFKDNESHFRDNSESMERFRLFLHPDESFLEGFGPVSSWIEKHLQPPIEEEESGFQGVLDELPMPDDLVDDTAFRSLQDSWKDWAPIPARSPMGDDWFKEDDPRILLSKPPDEITGISERAQDLLEALIDLEGDLLWHLHPDFLSPLTSDEASTPKPGNPGCLFVSDVEYLDPDSSESEEVKDPFYGGLLSVAFLAFERGKNGLNELVPQAIIETHLENHPQRNGQWPVFGWVLREGERHLVMVEQPDEVRHHVHLANTFDRTTWEEAPTLWSIKQQKVSGNDWKCNGDPEFRRLAQGRSEDLGDLDLIHLDHWPKSLKTLTEEAIDYLFDSQYTDDDEYQRHTVDDGWIIQTTVQSGPREGHPEITEMEIINPESGLKEFLDKDPTFLAPAFVRATPLWGDSARYELTHDRKIGRVTPTIKGDHKHDALFFPMKTNKKWLRCSHGIPLPNGVLQNDPADSGAAKDKNMAPRSWSQTSLITRVMSLGMMHLEKSRRGEDSVLGSQALLAVAATSELHRHEDYFRIYESWIEDGPSGKQRDVKFHAMRTRLGLRNTDGRHISSPEFNDLRENGFLGLDSDHDPRDNYRQLLWNQIANRTRWLPISRDASPPALNDPDAPPNLVTVEPIDAIGETDEDGKNRYEGVCQWLGHKDLTRQLDRSVDALLEAVKASSTENILSAFEVILRIHQAGVFDDARIDDWFRMTNNNPVPRAEVEKFRTAATSGWWATEEGAKRRDLALDATASTTATRPDFDKLVRDSNLDNDSLIPDCYVVSAGGGRLLGPNRGRPRKFSTFKDSAVVMTRAEAEDILGMMLPLDGAEIELDSLFRIKENTTILILRPRTSMDHDMGDYGLRRVKRKDVLSLEEVIGQAASSLQAANPDFSEDECEPEWVFLDSTLRTLVMSRLIESGQLNGGHIVERVGMMKPLEVIESEDSGELVTDPVTLGRHGWRISWDAGQFTLTIRSTSKLQTLTKMQRNITELVNFPPDLEGMYDILCDIDVDGYLENIQEQVIEESISKGGDFKSPWSESEFNRSRYIKEHFPDYDSPDMGVRRRISETSWSNRETDIRIDERTQAWRDIIRDQRDNSQMTMVDITAWKEEMYEGIHCMVANCRPGRSDFPTRDSRHTPIPRRAWHLIKPIRRSVFGKPPSHWTSVDFLGNTLFLCPGCADSLTKSSDDNRGWNIDSEIWETALEKAYEVGLQGNFQYVTVFGAANSPADLEVDAINLQFDKFHFMEMLAFHRAWSSRGD